MLSDKINEPLLDLDKCSLNKLINILQSFANDPSFNVHQTGFGSYIANHVIKGKKSSVEHVSLPRLVLLVRRTSGKSGLEHLHWCPKNVAGRGVGWAVLGASTGPLNFWARCPTTALPMPRPQNLQISTKFIKTIDVIRL
jgi:hypothetical protein